MPQQSDFEKEIVEREHFARLQELFNQAINLPPEDRKRFVESECSTNSVLLSEITGMLDADDGSSLLDQDVANLAKRVFARRGGFDHLQVGPYRLIGMLGEGGMGVVYLAEREDVGNPVAIKFLRDAWLSPSRRERFLSEQRMLAPLIHPCIARFYDAGTLENGEPWFAMEYVEGVPLTEYCRLHQSKLQERLHLFREVCDAVQYAHEHAVIHRDLKPSNILVKADRGVRLVDFGIAKQISDFSESVDQTQTLRMLTPAYAAPEQIRGEPVGVFTDVYALGAILYELLTGRPPIDLSKRTPGEIELSLVDGEPEKPSVATKSGLCLEASRANWADLDVLCLTAIDKDLRRRFRSADALARDVDRFLSNEPLQARPASALYKVGKFVRRHQLALIATAAVFLMVVSLVTFFLIRLTYARNEALAQAARSDRIKEFMQHLFDRDAQTGPSNDLRAVDVLDRGAQEAKRLAQEPRIEGELLQILGELYDRLGKLDQAQTLFNSALLVRRSAFGKESKEVAETMVSLGGVRGEQGKYPEAIRLIQDALAIESRVLPRSDYAFALARMELGRVLVESGDYQQAKHNLIEAVQSLSRSPTPTPDLFLALDSLGTAYFENGQVALADSSFHKALDLGHRLFKPTNPLIAEVLMNLGSVQFAMQRFSLAEQSYRAGLDATRAWYGPDHIMVASESRLLGQSLLQLGRNQEAGVYLSQALAIHEKSGGLAAADAVQDLNALAIALQRDGHLVKAEDYLNRMLRIDNTLHGGKGTVAAIGLNNLAGIKREEKQYARAEQLSRQALLVVREGLPPNHLYAGVILLELGNTLMKEKRFREAEPYLIESYSILGKQGNPSMTTLQKARLALAEDYAALGKVAEAHKLRTEWTASAQK